MGDNSHKGVGPGDRVGATAAEYAKLKISTIAEELRNEKNLSKKLGDALRQERRERDEVIARHLLVFETKLEGLRASIRAHRGAYTKLRRKYDHLRNGEQLKAL